ncbi:HK97 family phage prohead protease [Wenzhouxiangella sp. EGI_FJ10305]|uniref:HK97 family phage prohead protease n=1 Tax=Wenzhouxiangella sp. EGI_FJ10305 TaxID=3243768 RepID=UPI0035D96A87
MLHGVAEGGLTVRQEPDGSHVLTGRFPYGSTATISDGGRRGRPRKEQFAPGAFSHRVDAPDEDIHLLVGHDYGKPLASKLQGSLSLTDGDDALTFEARISPEVADTSHGRDALALLTAGLAVGLSPGFRIPPERAVANAESVEEEDPSEGDALIRTIHAALLYELSIVTRPAYSESQVESRNWNLTPRAKFGKQTWFSHR